VKFKLFEGIAVHKTLLDAAFGLNFVLFLRVLMMLLNSLGSCFW